MSDTCELCQRAALEPIYKPEKSTRGLTVYLCAVCGLLQSLPRIDRAARAPAAVSGGADWGNVRYGKGFRTQIAVEALRRHRDFASDFALLDVGSNRGSFARAFLSAAPQAHLVAVEPDERVAANCAGLARTQLIRERIENVALETDRFDAVHSCHTIEHLIHPAGTLADHHRTLKEGGILVIDAPNTALLASDDIVEEWFIDKHLYHFSEMTLTRMLEASGFTILERPDAKDRSNLFFVAKKNGKSPSNSGIDLDEVEYARGLIATLCRGPGAQPRRADRGGDRDSEPGAAARRDVGRRPAVRQPGDLWQIRRQFARGAGRQASEGACRRTARLRPDRTRRPRLRQARRGGGDEPRLRERDRPGSEPAHARRRDHPLFRPDEPRPRRGIGAVMALTLRSITEEAPRTAAQDLEEQLAKAAAFVRKHTIASIYHAGSGHPGAPCPAPISWPACSAPN